MRLAFITATPLSVRGGSGTFVGLSVLARALERQGHAVHWVAPPVASRLPFMLARFQFAVQARAWLAALRPQPDVVVGVDMDGVLCAPPPGAPYVVSVKGIIAEELKFERGAVRLSLWLQSLAERVNVHRGERVLSTSRYALERLRIDYGVPPQRLRLVPEPIDLAAWQAALQAAPAPAPSPPGRLRLLCVAHLYPRKSLGTLIDALARLGPTVQARVVGIGPCLERWQRQAQARGVAEQVRFLGHVSFRQLAAEYRGCDVFCLPSRQEGFGIVFLEAMAVGKPVVACAAAAVPEVVPDGRAGLLARPGDSAALAAALARLRDDPALRERLGAGGREQVQRYRAELVAQRFLEALAGLGAW